MLVDDPADADTVVVNTCGFVEAAKKDSVDTLLEAADLKDARQDPGRRGRRLPGRALRQGPRRVAARGRRRARLRRLPRHRRPAALDRGGGDPPRAHPAGPPPAAADLAGRPRRVRDLGARPRRRTAAPTRSVGCPGHRPARRTPPARRRPDGPAQAGQRLRPPLLVLRDPQLPRLVREPPARATCSQEAAVAGRPRASGSCSSSARTPRPTARTSATCGCSRRCCPSWPRSTASSGCGSPTSSPPRPGPGLIEAIADTPGRRALLRPVLPARQRDGAAPDAPLRRPGELPRPARADPRRWRPLAGVRSNVIVGFPGETEDDLADAVRLPRGRPDGRHRRVRLLRRGRHRGRVVRRQARRGRGPRPHRARHRPGRGAQRPARRGARSARRSTCSWSPSTRTAPSRAGPRTRAPRSTAPRPLTGCRRRAIGDLVTRGRSSAPTAST